MVSIVKVKFKEKPAPAFWLYTNADFAIVIDDNTLVGDRLYHCSFCAASVRMAQWSDTDEAYCTDCYRKNFTVLPRIKPLEFGMVDLDKKALELQFAHLGPLRACHVANALTLVIEDLTAMLQSVYGPQRKIKLAQRERRQALRTARTYRNYMLG